MEANRVDSETAAPVELSVVVPIYNEEESVGPLVARIREAMVDFNKPWELILVNDGSTDGTLVSARKELGTGLRLKIVELQRNFRSDRRHAGRYRSRVRQIDRHARRRPAERSARYSRDGQGDRGTRTRPPGRLAQKPPGRLAPAQDPSWCANYLIGKITGVKLHDYGCSLKVYQGSIIKQVKLMGEMHRFIPAWVAGVVPSSRIGEMPVTHHARQHGTSKYGISRTFRVILDLLSVLFFMRYKARPGHFFGSIGLAAGASAH